jgi:hypothetical protein
MNEYPVFVPLGEERLAGVLTVPDAEDVRWVWVLMVGQGAPRGTQYHYPLWTEVARRLAAHGIASMRIDHLGVGDSTGHHELLTPEGGREREPLAAARFAMAATGATTVGFAGHCYGARLAVDAAIALPECAGLIAAHYAPPVEAKDVSATRRWRYRIRRWRPVAWLSGTAFGRRVLEPIVTRVFGGSRTIEGRSEQLAQGLSEVLGRASVIFLSGDDEARYHLRLRPFLDRFVPTLLPERADRLEDVLSPVKDLGGYMSLEGQLTEIELIVDRAVRLAGSAGAPLVADPGVRMATGSDRA